jgi:hypothetical protein
MNPRQLDGGSTELASLILHNLQGSFPGVEFSVVPLDQTEFGVYWQYKAPGAPSEKAVRVHMASQWPSIDTKLGDSDEQMVADLAQAARNLQSVVRAVKPPKRSTKTCPRCGSEQRKSAKGCTQCGLGFPQCVYCGHVLQYDDKYCGHCGLAYCSYF